MPSRLALLLLLLVPCWAAPSAGASDRYEYRKVVMGTEARIVLYADSEEAARDGAALAFARMEELDAVLSDWRPDSELSRLSAAAGTGPQAVGDALFDVLSRAQRIARESAGAFDVTVGPYVRLWRAAREEGALPREDALAEARARVGFEKPRLDDASRTATLEVEGMALDLGAIGKGYAADAALATLRERGLPRALVDLGGDLVAGEPPPGEEGWRVSAGCGDAVREHLLANAALATSGATEQALEVAGVRYSHIVDPRTGLGLTEPLCVSVRAADGATADALASAASVLGRRAGRALVRAAGGALQVLDPRFSPAFPDGLAGWTADGGVRAEVSDGVVTARLGEDGAGGRLRSIEPFTAFELSLAVRLRGPLEVGLVCRESTDGRGIELALDSRPDGALGTVRSGGETWRNDAAKERWRPSEWNHLDVRVTGFDPRVEVWLEGEKLADVRPARDGAAFAPCGPVAFVLRGGDAGATFEAKDVVWRTLPVLDGDTAFEPLFNGSDLTGWEIADEDGVSGYRVAEGRLELLNAPGSGYLRTRDDHRDFRLRMEFRLAPRTNGGVFLRAARNGENPAFSGCEVQILDDEHWARASETELLANQRMGSLYGSVAPAVDATRPLGEWNTFEILYRGPRLAVALNHKTLYDVDTTTVPGKPFSERAPRGFIGLQRTGSRDGEDEVVLAFRRIEIAPWPEE